MRDFGTDHDWTVHPAEEALTVSVLGRGAFGTRLSAAWRSLDDNLAVPNPFFSEWMLRPALTHLDPDRRVRICVIRRAQDGLLVGLFPFEIGTRYARLPIRHIAIWKHAHGYNGAPLMRRGYAVAVLMAMLNWIDARPFGARFLRFTQLPLDPLMDGYLSDACTLAERAPREQSRIERAQLVENHDYETLMAAAMPGKKRKELRRQARRFGEMGMAKFVDLPMSDTAIAKAAEDFITLENAGWKADVDHGEPLARSEAERAFFMQAMRGGARAGAVSCLALTLDSDMAAMLFSLRSGRHLSAFKTSYDERHAAYSPGFRLIMEATEKFLGEPGIECVDSCARPGHPVVDRLWPDRLPVVQLNIPTNHPNDARLLDFAATVEQFKTRRIRGKAPCSI